MPVRTEKYSDHPPEGDSELRLLLLQLEQLEAAIRELIVALKP